MEAIAGDNDEEGEEATGEEWMGAQAAAVVDLAGHGSICVLGGSGNYIHAAARGSSTRREVCVWG